MKIHTALGKSRRTEIVEGFQLRVLRFKILILFFSKKDQERKFLGELRYEVMDGNRLLQQ